MTLTIDEKELYLYCRKIIDEQYEANEELKKKTGENEDDYCRGYKDGVEAILSMLEMEDCDGRNAQGNGR